MLNCLQTLCIIKVILWAIPFTKNTPSHLAVLLLHAFLHMLFFHTFTDRYNQGRITTPHPYDYSKSRILFHYLTAHFRCWCPPHSQECSPKLRSSDDLTVTIFFSGTHKNANVKLCHLNTGSSNRYHRFTL